MTHTKRRGGLIKSATGIPGFDEITGGGLPENRTTLVMGGPGSGKSVFALQSLVEEVRRGEAGVLVSFQESPRQIVENAATFGWDLAELEKDKLVILDARIRPNTFNSIELYLSGMLAGIRVVANEMRAKRIVFDSFDAFLALLGDRTTERHEIARLRDWLLESGLTSVITSQSEVEDMFLTPRQTSMQFMADCVVRLDYRITNHTSSRSLRVLKYRGSGFIENEFPVVIGDKGMELTSTGIVESVRRVHKERVNGGIQKEIEGAQGKFKAQIESLSRKLEIKQAELDFLKTKTSSQARPARQGKQTSTKSTVRNRSGRTVRKSLETTSAALSPQKP
ncbi:ATPase domain-containing protein [Pedosphaera parvula]|uniref:Putative circadian clock protein, KaiC n=1 Tax=Pedosphaera parvula (strain Ellin514) TaxID=320771 RepID=B9XHU6_PEDPL|nr:ATPase domain-containing protein [Pedosphaera parvula]EEF60674.1 putative circadian clock protein, KaiC [Pedosphaera parvula Ellin514]